MRYGNDVHLSWGWVVRRVMVLLSFVLFAGLASARTATCRVSDTYQGTEVYTTVDQLDTLVACIFPEWTAVEAGVCAKQFGPDVEHFRAASAGTCNVCVTRRPVCGQSCAAEIRDGSWGLFRAKVKSWSYPMDFSCLTRELPVPVVTPRSAGLGISCATPALAVPAARWDLNEGVGAEVVDTLNLSKSSIAGARWVSGRVGHALSFDGAKSFVSIANPSDLNVDRDDFSIEGWVKAPASANATTILAHRSANPYRGFHLYQYRGALGLQIADGAGKQYTNWNSYHAGRRAIVADGKVWHHFAVTVDRDDPKGLKFYVDGSEVAVFNPTVRRGSLTNDGKASIGRYAIQPTGYFKGSLDELGTYLGALTREEVESIYYASAVGKCN